MATPERTHPKKPRAREVRQEEEAKAGIRRREYLIWAGPPNLSRPFHPCMHAWMHTFSVGFGINYSLGNHFPLPPLAWWNSSPRTPAREPACQRAEFCYGPVLPSLTLSAPHTLHFPLKNIHFHFKIQTFAEKMSIPSTCRGTCPFFL